MLYCKATAWNTAWVLRLRRNRQCSRGALYLGNQPLVRCLPDLELQGCSCGVLRVLVRVLLAADIAATVLKLLRKPLLCCTALQCS